MEPQFSKTKTFIFSMTAVILGLLVINAVCALIAGNRDISLTPVSLKDSKRIPGYFAPNQEKTILFPGVRDYVATINSLGLRITSPLENEPKTVEELFQKESVLCLGDSETFGNQADNENTYAYQLQSMFNKAGKDVYVLNAGIGSGTMPDYAAYMKAWGLKLKPKVVIHQFFDNDIDSMKSWYRSKYDEMLDKSKFDAVSYLKDFPIVRVFRKAYVRHKWKRWIQKINDPRARNVLETDTTDLEENLYYYSRQYGGVNTDPFGEDMTPLWEKYFRSLDELWALLKAHDIALIYVIYPSITTLYDYGANNYQEVIIPELEKRKIPYVDLRKLFLPVKDRYLEIYADPPNDFHLNTFGKRIMAEEVFSLIKDKF